MDKNKIKEKARDVAKFALEVIDDILGKCQSVLSRFNDCRSAAYWNHNSKVLHEKHGFM